MNTENQIKVWDPLVRVGHWSLVGSFFLAYLTEDDFLTVHAWAGYVAGGVVGFRLLWGLVGTRYARFTSFVRGPSTVVAYLGEIVGGHPQRYIGHNPAGGAMVIALLFLVTLTVISGLGVYGGEEGAGPLAGVMQGSPHWLDEALEEIHEFLANFTLLLVALHVGGVILAGWQHGENLVRAMINGRKPAAQENEHA